MVKSFIILMSFITIVSLFVIICIVKFATEMDENKRNTAANRLANMADEFSEFSKEVDVFRLRSNHSIIAAKRFPYLVAITSGSRGTGWSFSCFGCIIRGQWVITAAHCKRPDRAHRVVLYYDYIKNRTKIYPIVIWKVHEGFDQNSTVPKYDIAVAKIGLHGSPAFSANVVVSKTEAKQVQASVWKTLIAMDQTTYLTNDLDLYPLLLAKDEKCYHYFGVKLDSSLLCVDMSTYMDCFVAEFGPIYAKGMNRIVGVLTTVKPKSCDTKVAVFTNVSWYFDWIVKSTESGDENGSVNQSVKAKTASVIKSA